MELSAVNSSHPASVSPAGRPSPADDLAPDAPPKAGPGNLAGEGDIRDAVRTLNDSLFRPPLEARYSVDDASRAIIIRIVNTESGEVLRQIPDEAAVRLAAAIAARAPAPNLVDEQA